MNTKLVYQGFNIYVGPLGIGGRASLAQIRILHSPLLADTETSIQSYLHCFLNRG